LAELDQYNPLAYSVPQLFCHLVIEVRNAVVEHCRDLKLQNPNCRDRTKPAEKGTDYAAMLDVEMKVTIDKWLKDAPFRQKVAIIGYFMEGLTEEELAAVMNIRRDSVKELKAEFIANAKKNSGNGHKKA